MQNDNVSRFQMAKFEAGEKVRISRSIRDFDTMRPPTINDGMLDAIMMVGTIVEEGFPYWYSGKLTTLYIVEINEHRWYFIEEWLEKTGESTFTTKNIYTMKGDE